MPTKLQNSVAVGRPDRGRIKPDIVAAGTWILSCGSSISVADVGPDGLTHSTVLNNLYADDADGIPTHDEAVGAPDCPEGLSLAPGTKMRLRSLQVRGRLRLIATSMNPAQAWQHRSLRALLHYFDNICEKCGLSQIHLPHC